ncbi:MAG: hypothetical protein ABL900_00365 [Burkholderiaceae bacterium]
MPAAKKTVANRVAPVKAKPTGVVKPKMKLVRDSFTMPKTEYAAIDALKQRALSLAHPVKKSELLRAGIGALKAMSDVAFLAAVKVIPSLKTGRPKRAKAPVAPGEGKRS